MAIVKVVNDDKNLLKGICYQHKSMRDSYMKYPS